MAAFRDYVDAPINTTLPSVEKTKYQPNEAPFSEHLRKNDVESAAIVFQQTTHAASSTGLTALQFLYPHPSTP